LLFGTAAAHCGSFSRGSTQQALPVSLFPAYNGSKKGGSSVERKILVPEAFWDVEEKELDLQRDREFIIARVLEHGTLEAVREVIRFYDRETIREVVKRSNLLSKKPGCFGLPSCKFPERM